MELGSGARLGPGICFALEQCQSEDSSLITGQGKELVLDWQTNDCGK